LQLLNLLVKFQVQMFIFVAAVAAAVLLATVAVDLAAVAVVEHSQLLV
jgi:hypothetical protein